MGSVQRRIAILLGALAASFVLLVPVITAMQGRHVRLLVERSRERSTEAADIERLIGLARTKFASFIVDYTWWDEFARFAQKPDPAWAADNIDSSFEACQFDRIWVVDRRLRVVHAAGAPGTKIPAALPFPAKWLAEELRNGPYLATWARIPGGIAEIRAGRIHFSNDPKRTGPYTGYLVAGHTWSDADARDLGSLTDCKVKLVMADAAPKPMAETAVGPASYRFTAPLKSFDGAHIARLEFAGTDQAGLVLAESEMRDRWLILVFAGVLYLGLAVALTLWVSRPLGAISRALETERSESLAVIAPRGDEFGHVATNLRAFFDQKRQLESEIAERKRVEVALRASEERLQALTTELQRSNRELQDFASVASHDLQEPLRKMSAFGDRLARKVSDILPPDARDYLTRMMGAVARMQGLIDDLLTYSRVTTRAKPFEKTDLNALAAEVVSDLEGRLMQFGGTVEVGDLPTAEVDPSQMRQLLQNLIGNALKFRREGVAPVVRVSGQIVEESSGPWCRIAVADNGIGFDEQYSERIFRVFERLHSREQYEGTGMGLAIVKKIAERHGGSVDAKGVLNEGATFTVMLPATRPATDAPPEAVPA